MAACKRLLLVPQDLFEFRLVFHFPAGSRFCLHHAHRLGLAHPLARVSLYRLGGGKTGWLAFSHRKVEYEVDSA